MKVKGHEFFAEVSGRDWENYVSFQSHVRMQRLRDTWTAWLVDCCIEVRGGGRTPDDAWDALRAEIIHRQNKVLERLKGFGDAT